MSTVEPLYFRLLGTRRDCPDYEAVLISGVEDVLCTRRGGGYYFGTTSFVLCREVHYISNSTINLSFPLVVFQVTKMYEAAVKERESVVARLAVMDKERRELIDAKEEGHKKLREANKVSCWTVHTYVRMYIHTHR